MKVELTLSIVLAASTVCYTIINLMMWFESRATRKQKILPFIVAYLQSTDNHNVEVLHIKNIGEGYAKDVRFKVIKDSETAIYYYPNAGQSSVAYHLFLLNMKLLITLKAGVILGRKTYVTPSSWKSPIKEWTAKLFTMNITYL